MDQLAKLLEEYGYKNARDLVHLELVPIARSRKISLVDAAWEYANQDEEQDTSYYQLFHVLQSIPLERLIALRESHLDE
ncbi:MAG: hypothetical protein KW793_02975 [Candidatus Doudnabacteria bacterium]|nr:hypothetical protein [Candidatus Doudnabacteria bacterium]